MKKSIFVVAACAALFAVGVVGFISLLAGGIMFATNGAAESADGFLTSVANGDNQAARSFMSVEFSNSLADTELESLIAENEFNQFAFSNWQQRSVENGVGELEGSMTTKSGVEIPMTVQLIEEQGNWKIQGIQRSDFFSSGIKEALPLVQNKPADEPGYPSKNTGNSDSNLTKSRSTAKIPLAVRSKTKQPIRSEKKKTENTVEQLAIAALDNGTLSTTDIPDRWQAASIVKKWTIEFCQGITNQNFSDFHAKTTPQFQKQVPLEKFTQIFDRFLQNNIDMMWVDNVEPELSRSPSLDADGVLRLEGSFPAVPPVKFDYSFQKISGDWQLLQINLVVNPPGENLTIPSMEELKQLARAQTRRFGKSITKQDFSYFHQDASKTFRSEVSLAKFSTIFRSFFENNADLSWIGSTPPIFDAPPSLNTNGQLALQGYFPVEPRVNFEYGFVNEDSQWKITSVNISIPSDKQIVQ